jgi:hypothetical protein
VAEPSASNAGQRPVSRRQALAYGSSLAAALPPHPPRPLRPRHRRRPPAQHLSVSLAQAKCIVAAAERRARQIGVSMFIVVVDDYGVIEMSSRMDGNSQASVTVVPPKAVTANAFRTPTAMLAQGAGDPTRLASIVGAGFSLAGPSGDASQKPSQPQEASNDGADPLRPARWRIRHRSGG